MEPVRGGSFIKFQAVGPGRRDENIILEAYWWPALSRKTYGMVGKNGRRVTDGKFTSSSGWCGSHQQKQILDIVYIG